ncbi:MAG: nodulation protein NfeD [Candidatus Krumholzibacteriota bacterium]|nr:nodulation protein NfeD [Candidatus Krumholzibacteriota bacterium]
MHAKRLILCSVLAAALSLSTAIDALAASRVLVVPVSGEIQLGLAPFVERSTREAEDGGFDLVIYEINTFGGRLDAAVVIRDAIINADIETIAFVNKRAISAGALVTLAANRIYMHPQSTIGAAEPVSIGIGGKSGEVSEKVVSYWRSELRSTAEKNDRDGRIAEAFADKSIEIEGVIGEGKLLTLTASQAIELGMADAAAGSIEDILSAEGIAGATVVRTSPNAAERLAGFLTMSVVSSLLLTLAIIGIFIEIRTPGFGVAGIVALIALVLFFGSHYLVNLAGWGELLLFAFGVILLLVEIFLIPGFGIVGTVGIIAIVSSFYLSLVGRFVEVTDFVSGAKVLALSFVLSFALILVVLRFLPKFAPFQRLVLSTSETTEKGFRSSPDSLEDLLGMEGVAVTMLRPAGTALIGATKVSVVTEGDFIEKDSRIVVTEVEGYRIVVKKS